MRATYNIIISLLVLDHQLRPGTVVFLSILYVATLNCAIHQLFCRHFRRNGLYVTALAAPPQVGLISCSLNTCKLCHLLICR